MYHRLPPLCLPGWPRLAYSGNSALTAPSDEGGARGDWRSRRRRRLAQPATPSASLPHPLLLYLNGHAHFHAFGSALAHSQSTRPSVLSSPLLLCCCPSHYYIRDGTNLAWCAMKLLATSALLYLSFLLDTLSGAHAIRISGRHVPREERLQRRGAMTPTLRDDGDLKYYTNITLNDQAFPVLIDTGR